jgi:hypothetical protein
MQAHGGNKNAVAFKRCCFYVVKRCSKRQALAIKVESIDNQKHMLSCQPSFRAVHLSDCMALLTILHKRGAKGNLLPRARDDDGGVFVFENYTSQLC